MVLDVDEVEKSISNTISDWFPYKFFFGVSYNLPYFTSFGSQDSATMSFVRFVVSFVMLDIVNCSFRLAADAKVF